MGDKGKLESGALGKSGIQKQKRKKSKRKPIDSVRKRPEEFSRGILNRKDLIGFYRVTHWLKRQHPKLEREILKIEREMRKLEFEKKRG